MKLRIFSMMPIAVLALTTGTAFASSVAFSSNDCSASFDSGLLSNGSFECIGMNEPVLDNGSWATFDAIPGWTAIDIDRDGPDNGNAFEIQTNPTLSSIDADHGKNYVELDAHGEGSNSAIRQTIELNVGHYELSFAYSPRESADSQDTNLVNYRVRKHGKTPLILDTISGPGGDVKVGKWTEVKQTFYAESFGTYHFDFWAGGMENTLGGFIDSVSLQPVPLPAPALMLLAGVGALGAMRRKKT